MSIIDRDFGLRSSISLRLSSTLTSPSLLAGGVLGGVVGGVAALFGAPFLPVAAVAGAGAYALCGRIDNVIVGGKSLRPAVFLEVEPLSQSISGGNISLTISPILQCVKEMDGSNARKLQEHLESMYFYDQHFDYTGLTNRELVAFYQKKISALQPGESLALGCDAMRTLKKPPFLEGHAMVAVIERVGKKFSVTIHNGGDGVYHYHYYKASSSSSKKYQTALCIEGIEPSCILSFVQDLASLKAVGSKNCAKRLYEEILPALKGKVAPSSEDQRLWASGQTGSSCSGYSIRCLIKSVLTNEEYREFHARFISLMIKNLEEGTHSFFENTSSHRMVLNALKLKAQAYPKHFLPKNIGESLRASMEKEPRNESFAFNCSIAFFRLNPRISKLDTTLKKSLDVGQSHEEVFIYS